MPRHSLRQVILRELQDALIVETSVRERQQQLSVIQSIVRGESPRKALLDSIAQDPALKRHNAVIHLVCQWLLLSPPNARPSLAKLLQKYLVAIARPDNAMYHALIESNRYLSPRKNHARDRTRIQYILEHEQEASFTSHARMNKRSFRNLVKMIENQQVFHSDTHHPQEAVKVQLLTALRRFGLSGNGASFIQNKSNTQIPGILLAFIFKT